MQGVSRSWSPKAKQNLLNIWNYVGIDASAAIADKFLEIDDACYALGAWPEYGKARDDVRKGPRTILVSRYVVLYRLSENVVEIVRVLDEWRDVQYIFLNESGE